MSAYFKTNEYFTFKGDKPIIWDKEKDIDHIISFLNLIGDVNNVLLTREKVAELYRDFSEDWYCAGWIECDPEHIVEFARWLNSRE